jgi:hypothetical protein
MRTVLVLVLLVFLSGVASAALPVHPWWDLSEEQIYDHFAYGELCYQAGKKSTELGYFTQKDIPLGFGCEIGRIEFVAPPGALGQAGYESERKMLLGTQSERLMLDTWQAYKRVISFRILINASDFSAAKDIEVALVNDANIQIPKASSAKPMVRPIGDISGRRYLIGLQENFSLYREDGIPYLMPTNKRVKLAITYNENRAAVTFWIDNSARIETGGMR